MPADKKFQEDCLKSHNDYRKCHGVPPLKLNKDISKLSQKWADHLASKGLFEHTQGLKYKGDNIGENLAMKWTSNNLEYLGHEGVDSWYNEIERYNFSTNSGPKTGHFTQVVWKDSQELGVGKAQGKDGKWILVCNYYPAGNYIGCHPQNVFPQGSKPQAATAQPEATRKVSRLDWPLDNGGNMGCNVGGTSKSRSIKTQTMTEDRGEGVKTYVKKIITETTILPDGSKQVSTTEEETCGDAKDFEKMFSDKKPQVDFDNNIICDKNIPVKKIQSRAADPTEAQKPPQKMDDFIKEAVKFHNKYRKAHGKAGDLKHNKNISAIAQKWAEKLAASGQLSHSNNSFEGDQMGENVASKWGSNGADYTGEQVVDQWYSEVSKFKFGGDHQPGTGHFTQVVWKASKEIGIGKAFGKDGRVFVVANYHPAGNVIGQFKDNVSSK